ncbi:hypothetical protein FP568_09230 [Pandoraea pnomenusa]|uniref:hypothetical protein n=1 Tax=Pandoraea pnomenusa TaxID=93220 RepID=UPI001198887C|nr:hypothetical protein [Pandoraea pnomenusa]QDX21416.1 hypothetical protein FP568_09230 [Pandoraea pnomenusa]
MNKNVIIAALAAALAPRVGFVPRGIVSVRADASLPEVKALVESVQKAFAEFKAANDKEIAELKAGRVSSDTLAKVDKVSTDLTDLQAALDDMNVKLAAAQMGAGGGKQLRDSEYTESFYAHMKKGEVQAALNKGANEEGGYAQRRRVERR